MMRFVNDPELCECVSALCDVVDYNTPEVVPASEPYATTLQKQVEAHRAFVQSDRQRRQVSVVLEQLEATFAACLTLTP